MTAPCASSVTLPPAPRRAISVFDGEPIREALAIQEAAVSIVDRVADFVDQHIVQVKVADGILRPVQHPAGSILFPTSAEHARFDDLLRSRRVDVSLRQRGLDRIKVDRRTPLHAVAGKQSPLARHLAELNHFEVLKVFFWQKRDPLSHVLGRHRMQVVVPGRLHAIFHGISADRLVPDLGRSKSFGNRPLAGTSLAECGRRTRGPRRKRARRKIESLGGGSMV